MPTQPTDSRGPRRALDGAITIGPEAAGASATHHRQDPAMTRPLASAPVPNVIERATGRKDFKAAVVLGSGLSPLATSLVGGHGIPYGESKGCRQSTVEGHDGSLFFGDMRQQRDPRVRRPRSSLRRADHPRSYLPGPRRDRGRLRHDRSHERRRRDPRGARGRRAMPDRRSSEPHGPEPAAGPERRFDRTPLPRPDRGLRPGAPRPGAQPSIPA